MRRCWGRNIRALLSKAALFAVLVAVSAAATDPLADLKTGAAALEQKKYAAAIAALQPLAKRLPKIADYISFFLASAQVESGDYASAPKVLDQVFKTVPPSPLAPKAALLAARAFSQNDDPKSALDVLKKNYSTLPQPAGDLAMALAFSAANDLASATSYHQRVYYGFPVSPEAAQSEAELTKLGAKSATPAAMFGRAMKLMEAKQYAKARGELITVAPLLGGAEKDIARVRIGVADYNAKETPRAHTTLSTLEVATPEADAERLHYLLLCAQRLKNQEVVSALLEKLSRLNPHSKWRLES